MISPTGPGSGGSIFERASGVIRPKVSTDSFGMPVGRCTSYVIAASNSPHSEQADDTCNGVNDEVNINAALLDVKDVLLMEGDFSAAGITLQEGNRFHGCGFGTKITLPDMTHSDIICGHNKNNIEIFDMQLDGNQANQNPVWFKKYDGGSGSELDLNGIWIDGITTPCGDINIHDVWSHDAGNCGIEMYDSVSNCRITNCVVNGCEWHDIALWQNISNSTINNCYFADSYSDEVAIELPAMTTTVTNNKIIGRGGVNSNSDALCILRATEPCIISNNIITNAFLRVHGDVGGAVADAIITGNTIKNASDHAIHLLSAERAIVTNNQIFQPSVWKHCLSLHTVVDSCIGGNILTTSGRTALGMTDALRNHFIGNEIITVGITMLEEAGSSDHNIFESNVFRNTAGAATCTVIGANSKIRRNTGYVTENSGTDTVAAGSTTKNVTHGLAVTPVAGDIMITPLGSLGNASEFYISAYSSTTFTITVDVNPGAPGIPFAWQADVL